MTTNGRKVVKRANLDAVAASGSDLTTDYVHTPEWSEEGDDPSTVYACIKALTGTERDQFEASVVVQRGRSRELNLRNVRAKLVAKCLIDPDTGIRLYSEQEIDTLGQRSAAVLDRLFDACRKLSGLTQADVDELTDDLKNGQSA